MFRGVQKNPDAFARTTTTTGMESPVPHLHVTVEYEYAQYPRHYVQPVQACVRLKTVLTQPQTQQPLTDEEVVACERLARHPHMVLVIDVSDSMLPTLPWLKQVMRKVTETVKGNHVGVVTFATQAEVLCPLLPLCDEKDQQHLLQCVNALTASGNTNLCEGLEKGLTTLWPEVRGMTAGVSSMSSKISSMASGADHVARRVLILLTDGLANEGVYQSASIQARLATHPHLKDTDIYCLALGQNVNADLLGSIVSDHNGRLYALTAERDLAASIGDCLGSVCSTLFTEVDVTVPRSQPSQWHVGTLFVNDSRDLLVTLHPKKSHQVQVDYTTPTSERKTLVVKLPPLPRANVTQPLRRNAHLRQQQLRLEVSQMLQDWDQTLPVLQQSIRNIREEIQREGWSDVPLCRDLLYCLKEMEAQNASRTLRRSLSVGLHMQRQTSGDGLSSYTTALQRFQAFAFRDALPYIPTTPPAQPLAAVGTQPPPLVRTSSHAPWPPHHADPAFHHAETTSNHAEPAAHPCDFPLPRPPAD